MVKLNEDQQAYLVTLLEKTAKENPKERQKMGELGILEAVRELPNEVPHAIAMMDAYTEIVRDAIELQAENMDETLSEKEMNEAILLVKQHGNEDDDDMVIEKILEIVGRREENISS